MQNTITTILYWNLIKDHLAWSIPILFRFVIYFNQLLSQLIYYCFVLIHLYFKLILFYFQFNIFFLDLLFLVFRPLIIIWSQYLSFFILNYFSTSSISMFTKINQILIPLSNPLIFFICRFWVDLNFFIPKEIYV